MRYLGIDYGSRTIGIALSDTTGQFAFPLESLPNDAHTIENIAHVIHDKEVSGLVIGDTRAANGGANVITEACERFAAQLTERTKLPISTSREAWSSLEASRFAPKGRGRDDAASAAIILQRFLDAQMNRE